MTRKDYIIIANNMKSLMPEKEQEQLYKAWVSWVESMAHELWQDNPKFLYRRFYDACGLVDGKD